MRNPFPSSHMPQSQQRWEAGCKLVGIGLLEHRMEETNLKVKVEVSSGGRYLESSWMMTEAEILLFPHSADQDWREEGG